MSEPKIAQNVKEVVLMGGAANAKGNASGTAEANVRNDPEAAKIVFEAPWKVTMAGLDVTTKTIMSGVINAIAKFMAIGLFPVFR